MGNPLFEQKIKDRIVDPARMQQVTTTYGLIVQYNKRDNTAHVLPSRPGSDAFGEILTNVPCPTTPGIQGRAPKLGYACVISFKDGVASNPFITHYWNPHHEQYEYANQYNAKNVIPRFMLEM